MSDNTAGVPALPPRERPMPQLQGTLLGINYWSKSGGPFMWRDYDEQMVREELIQLLDLGITHTRSFLFWPDFHPSPETVAEPFVERYLRFLDLSAELGIPTIPTFLVGHMSGEDWDVSWREGRDLYTDEWMLGRQAFFIREIVRRSADHPGIWGWLISNEFSNYAGGSTPDGVRRWAEVCVAAVREAGSAHPVSLGDGAWTAEIGGLDHNGFRIKRQLDLVDFIGPHSYPMDDDRTRVHFAAAWVTEMAHYGLPVVLEEFGVPDTLSSRDNAAALYRQAFSLSLLSGAVGWMPWNNTDFALRDQPPYSHHPFELGFGIVDTDGVPKPVAHAVSRFSRELRGIGVRDLSRAPSDVSIVVPSYLDEHPRVPQAERTVASDITRHAFIAAKLSGLAPFMARESRDEVAARLVIVPSNKLLTGPTFDELEAAAAAGAVVYAAWFSGVSGSHRGSWWPDVDGFVGATHGLRYGMREPIDDVVTWTFERPLGDLTAGDQLSFPYAGALQARSMLPLESVEEGTEVLARDAQGRIALTRRAVGAGSVVVSTYSVEYFASAREHAHESDDVRRLYRALAVEAGVGAAEFSVPDRVVHEVLRRNDGSQVHVVVNTTASDVIVDFPGDARLCDAGTGSSVSGETVIGAFDYVIALRGEVLT